MKQMLEWRLTHRECEHASATLRECLTRWRLPLREIQMSRFYLQFNDVYKFL